MLEAALTLFSAAFSLYVCKNMGANKKKKKERERVSEAVVERQ